MKKWELAEQKTHRRPVGGTPAPVRETEVRFDHER